MKTTRTLLITSFAIILTMLSGCSPSLQNIGVLKKEVTKYYESGLYESELKEIINDAKSEIEKISAASMSAIILDVDETTLSNYAYIKYYDYGYEKKAWDEWIAKEEAEPIIPVRDLYNYLIDRGFRIIFITGRKDYQYGATYNNLINAGYTKFDTLITRSSHDQGKSAVEYKSIKRTELTAKGYEIKANIGDQWSDIEGTFSGIKVKLPNYQYSID